ncbi:hypothetical protein AQUCO_02000209v1 [Aquilegia coerulea]|nr:hypothetical protein AQUCO_02000209v1 [Aquilegia coerulea]
MGRALPKRLLMKKKKGPYYCGFCYDDFKYNDGPARHAKSVHYSADIVCLYCGTEFSDVDAHATHFQDKHVTNFKDEECKICQTQVDGIADFIHHMKNNHAVF